MQVPTTLSGLRLKIDIGDREATMMVSVRWRCKYII